MSKALLNPKMPKFCPCGSQKLYQTCCCPLHKGQLAQNALLLMRSRYSAYACHQADYIMRTTHPKNSAYQTDFVQWRQDILLFCQQTKFLKLEIVEFLDGEQEAFVSFIAHLEQNGTNFQLIEKSRFQKLNNQWLYLDGEFMA